MLKSLLGLNTLLPYLFLFCWASLLSKSQTNPLQILPKMEPKKLKVPQMIPVLLWGLDACYASISWSPLFLSSSSYSRSALLRSRASSPWAGVSFDSSPSCSSISTVNLYEDLGFLSGLWGRGASLGPVGCCLADTGLYLLPPVSA